MEKPLCGLLGTSTAVKQLLDVFSELKINGNFRIYRNCSTTAENAAQCSLVAESRGQFTPAAAFRLALLMTAIS